jgi:serine/threonine protein kinase
VPNPGQRIIVVGTDAVAARLAGEARLRGVDAQQDPHPASRIHLLKAKELIAILEGLMATETGRPYFAMELVRGIKITDYCDEKKLPVRERLDLFIQVCQAIQHAHQKGIIHRDIKPANIMLTPRGQVKVMDFGLAKLRGSLKLTKTSSTVGTLAYMAPEQVRGQAADARSDIFALGCLLYEMLAGKRAFVRETASETMAAMPEMSPPPPTGTIIPFRSGTSSRISRPIVPWPAMICSSPTPRIAPLKI